MMFYRRCSIFCRVWLNSKTFTHAVFLTHANHATHAKISTHATHAKMLWTHVTHPKIWIHVTHVIHAKILWTTLPTPTTLKFDPRTHAPILPTPPTNPRHPRDLADSACVKLEIFLLSIIGNWLKKTCHTFPRAYAQKKYKNIYSPEAYSI